MHKFKAIRRVGFLILLAYLVLLSYGAEAFFYGNKNQVSQALAHYAMGLMYDQIGLTNRAVMEYEAAVDLDNESYIPHLKLGTGYARLGLLDEAVKELTLVNSVNPSEMQSHYLLAIIYATRQDYVNAAKEYEFILKDLSKKEPQNTEVYGYLGQLYYSQSNYPQAIEQFENILKIEPNNSEVMYVLSSIYLETDKKEKAVEVLRRSISVDPQHDGSLNSLGYIFAEENKNLEEAKSLIERALKIDPNNGAYLDSLAWVYYQQGDYNKALDYLLQAKERMEDPVIYEHLGETYIKLGKVSEAVDSWENSLKLNPEQERLINKIAQLRRSPED
ncbi:MAG: tetratricopeptide repeat protein, partial [Candidatus Omnitrophica bacterium]|nr:tetratricopeptide repeat protein [Candidatus Omnitrophota bacterium]